MIRVLKTCEHGEILSESKRNEDLEIIIIVLLYY